MAATQIFPLAVWTSQITQASIPANDNALRLQANDQGAIGIQNAQPATPTEDDLYIIGSTPTGAQWSTFTPNNIAVFKGGTWLEFKSYVGMVKGVGTDVYSFNGTTWNLFAVGPSAEPWNYIRLTTDFVNSTNVYSDVTGLSFACQSGKLYEVQIFGAYKTAAGTTGIGFQLGGPAASSFIGKIEIFTSATATGGANQFSDTTPTTVTTGVTTANTNTPVDGRFLVSTTASGTVQLRFRSEINSSAATIVGGLFFMQWREIP